MAISMQKRSFGVIVFIFFMGIIFGSALGKILTFILPEGVVKQFFLRTLLNIGFDPFTLNLGVIDFTLGFKFVVNIVGLLGIIIIAYLLRWYYGHRL